MYCRASATLWIRSSCLMTVIVPPRCRERISPGQSPPDHYRNSGARHLRNSPIGGVLIWILVLSCWSFVFESRCVLVGADQVSTERLGAQFTKGASVGKIPLHPNPDKLFLPITLPRLIVECNGNVHRVGVSRRQQTVLSEEKLQVPCKHDMSVFEGKWKVGRINDVNLDSQLGGYALIRRNEAGSPIENVHPLFKRSLLQCDAFLHGFCRIEQGFDLLIGRFRHIKKLFGLYVGGLNQFFGLLSGASHGRKLPFHELCLFLHGFPLEAHKRPLALHFVCLTPDEDERSKQQPYLQTADYDKQSAKHQINDVALPCPYSDGREFADFYSLLGFVICAFGAVGTLISLGCCRIGSGRRLSGWSLFTAGVLVDAGACSSTDREQHSQNQYFHRDKIVQDITRQFGDLALLYASVFRPSVVICCTMAALDAVTALRKSP